MYSNPTLWFSISCCNTNTISPSPNDLQGYVKASLSNYNKFKKDISVQISIDSALTEHLKGNSMEIYSVYKFFR